MSKAAASVRLCSLVLFLDVIVPATTVAQSVDELHLGARIEVTPTRGTASTGVFSSLAHDSLSFVLNDATATRVVLPLGQIKAVRVSEGRSRSRGGVKGALIGTLVGVAAGGIVGAATTPQPRGDCMLDCSRSQSAVFAGIFYGGVGLVGGAIIGAFANRESWTPVDLRKVK